MRKGCNEGAVSDTRSILSRTPSAEVIGFAPGHEVSGSFLGGAQDPSAEPGIKLTRQEVEIKYDGPTSEQSQP